MAALVFEAGTAGAAGTLWDDRDGVGQDSGREGFASRKVPEHVHRPAQRNERAVPLTVDCGPKLEVRLGSEIRFADCTFGDAGNATGNFAVQDGF